MEIETKKLDTAKVKNMTTIDCILNGYKPTLTIEEMAKLLSISVSTMRVLCQGGYTTPPPPIYKLGKVWRCNLRDFAAWTDSQPIEWQRQNRKKK